MKREGLDKPDDEDASIRKTRNHWQADGVERYVSY
jgi:hypothetical protein